MEGFTPTRLPEIRDWLTHGIELGKFVILRGDFNAIMDRLSGGKQMNIRQWIEYLGLVAPFTDILLPDFPYYTQYAGGSRKPSHIDRVFHSVATMGITCSKIGTSNDSILDGFDHRHV
jgi:hypothetical protein